MSTFLEICNDVARESGVFPRLPALTTVESVSGRDLRLINWVNDAYQKIQKDQSGWDWLRADFSGGLVADKQTYSPSDLGINERFSDWLLNDACGISNFSCYLTSLGRSDEIRIWYVPWLEFRQTYMFGSAADDKRKPTFFSVTPEREITLYPTPDAAYTMRGVYQKNPQVLALDADVPEMPADYHKAIQWGALKLLGVWDEAAMQLPMWNMEYADVMAALRAEQNPVSIGSEPFA